MMLEEQKKKDDELNLILNHKLQLCEVPDYLKNPKKEKD